jgi:hypothetical protein
MANLVVERNTVPLSNVMYQPELGPYGCPASTIVRKGLMKTLDANARPKDPGAVGEVVIGVVKETKENIIPNSIGQANVGANDALWATFLTGIFRFDQHATRPITAQDVANQAPVYASDNHTLSRSPGDGSPAGFAVLIEGTAIVWAFIGPLGTGGGALALGPGEGLFGLTPSTNAITAFAGGGQASGVLLTSYINRVTIVATAADSVKLPIAQPGMQITVINAAAANSLNVFPGLGDAINAGAANAAFAVVAAKAATFYCAVAGFWSAILSA